MVNKVTSDSYKNIPTSPSLAPFSNTIFPSESINFVSTRNSFAATVLTPNTIVGLLNLVVDQKFLLEVVV